MAYVLDKRRMGPLGCEVDVTRTSRNISPFWGASGRAGDSRAGDENIRERKHGNSPRAEHLPREQDT